MFSQARTSIREHWRVDPTLSSVQGILRYIFDDSLSGDHSDPPSGGRLIERALPGSERLAAWREELMFFDGRRCSQAERIDLIAGAEQLKGALAAVQARVSCAFDEAQRAAEAERGVPAGRRGRDVAAQIALARRESPSRGSMHLGLARALVREMPHTHAAPARGDVAEWRATLVVQETAAVSVEHRRSVDAELAEELPGGVPPGSILVPWFVAGRLPTAPVG